MSETQRIHILPEFIANQIAAGEVVQRPESVIKELVENSLDAGATHITVLVRQAGKALIHVIDNGSGMSKEDVLLAPKRHATSKIRSAEDLMKIHTLGFRGEALASISSVAVLEICTRQASNEHGWKLMAEPLRDVSIEAIQQEPGTQIYVRNLFYNIPARRKFLRSDLTEFRHISDTMTRFALSYPSVRFTFHDGDSLIFDVRPQSQRERIRELFGENIERELVAVERDDESIRIHGYLGKPSIARSSRAQQFFFLNQRSIASKALSHAVYQAFEHLIDKSQHPLYVLNIDMDVSKIDVNVHPQKTEVKFDDERRLYTLVHEAALAALRNNSLIPEVHFGLQNSQAPFEKIAFGPTEAQNDMVLVNKMTGEIVDSHDPSSARTGFTVPERTSPPPGGFRTGAALAPPPVPKAEWNAAHQTAFDALFHEPTLGDDHSSREAEARFAATDALIWQLHNKYIFVQTVEGLMIVDQHIAHERILYEKALSAMNNDYNYAQKLLFPVVVHLTPSEDVLMRELDAELSGLGYDFRTLDEGLEISGVPLDVKSGEEASSLHEILEQYAEYAVVRTASGRDNLAASFGCRAAIKAGDPLSKPQMKKLIDDLFQCRTPEVCPHGRPVMIKMELKEFDRRFGRTS